MTLTRFALRNPLIVAALSLVVLIVGVAGYLSMGIGVTPNISLPTVVITTTDAGADPTTIETHVTTPIENAVAALANVDTVTSTSDQGQSVVTVAFTAAANSTLAPLDVERAVNAVRNQLPAEADPPTITKLDTSSIPVLTVALSGPQTQEQLRQLADDQVQRAFEAAPGVQAVSVSGGEQREIQVRVDPIKLQAYGLGLNTIQQALESEQVEIPAGALTAQGAQTSALLDALAAQPAQLGQIVVKRTPQGAVLLRDVATVEDGVATVQTIDRVNGQPAVALTITKAADANVIAVSQGIRQAMAQLAPTLPPGMHLDVAADAAVYTQQAFAAIRKMLVEAVLLTGLVLLLFLHAWRSTAIVLIAIPTSLLTTFGLMNLLGMNLNLLSMLALTLSVGILVDDSIVILENIVRHLGLGEPPVLAALHGRSEIGLAAVTITAVDVAVYLPIALISGLFGAFIRPFALVIVCATLTSLLVSFTITPLLAGRWLRREQPPAGSRTPGPWRRLGARWDAAYAAVARSYRRLLRHVLTGRLAFLSLHWVVIAVGLVAFVAGLGLFKAGGIGIDIFPSGDQSEVDLTLTMPPATALAVTDATVQQLTAALLARPAIREVYADTGAPAFSFTGAAGGNTARLTILLVPPNRRTQSAAQLADQFRSTLAPLAPGGRLDVGLPNAFGQGGAGGQAIQVAVRGPDPATLDQLVEQVTAAMQQTPGVVDVNNANQNVQPQDVVHVDRQAAADLGVTAQAAGEALRTAIQGTVVAAYRQPGQDDVNVRLMTAPGFAASPSNLATLPLLAANGTTVPLGQIASITRGMAPVQIAHYDRERSVTVNASVSGQTVGSVQQAVQRRLAQFPLPPGYSIVYAGGAATGARAFADMLKALGLGVLLIYLLLLLLFRSPTLPLAVLMSLPLALVGALGAMAVTRTPFTLFSLLGFAVLLGLVGKNAILLVDYTDTLRRRGQARTEALLEAGPTRLRPIAMTTLAMFAAMAPLALGFEPGSALLKTAAVVLMGGLLTSTLLTLVVVPAMYTLFDDLQEQARRASRRWLTPRPLAPEEVRLLRLERIGPVDGGSRAKGRADRI